MVAILIPKVRSFDSKCSEHLCTETSEYIFRANQCEEGKYESVPGNSVPVEIAPEFLGPEELSEIDNVPNKIAVLIQDKYPVYTEKERRRASFKNWPKKQSQDSHSMAKAGFYYTGSDDCARCFCCGIGLCNWEPCDDPWIEHAVWSPRCAHLMQTKGKTFITAVQRMARAASRLAPTAASVVQDSPIGMESDIRRLAMDLTGEESQRPNVTMIVNVTSKNVIVGENGVITVKRKNSGDWTDMQMRMLEDSNGLYYLFIKKFSYMKREANNNRSDLSQRYIDFVYQRGYKIRVNAFISDHALCFKFQVLCGEKDDFLHWPFCPRIKLTLVDQQDKDRNINATYISGTDNPCFSFPLPLDKFDSDGYVKGDTICIMVHVEANSCDTKLICLLLVIFSCFITLIFM